MTRGIAALFVLLMMASASAQGPGPDYGWDRPDRSERARAREERRAERRERMERFRERFRGEGVHLRILRSYALGEGETATEPVVVLGGSARIDGHLQDDVVVVGGSLRLGPKAVVDGNVVTVGGSVIREAGATVAGTIDEAAVPWPSVVFDPDWNLGGFWQTAAIWGSVLRLAFILLISILLTLAAPRWISGIAERPATSSGFLGFVAEVLFVPALVVLIVMLIVSIIGIPLLAAIPFLLAGFAFLWVAGFTGVAVRLGRALRGSQAMHATVGDLVLGYAAIVGVTVIGHLLALGLGWVSPMTWPVRSAGLVIEYVAWTIGLGAAVTSLFAAPRVIPPPFPTQSGLSGL